MCLDKTGLKRVTRAHVDAPSVGPHRSHRVAVDGEIVHESLPHVEAREEIVRPSGGGERVVADQGCPIEGRVEHNIVHRGERCPIQIDAVVGIEDANLVHPGVDDPVEVNRVVAAFEKMAGIARAGELNGDAFNAR